MFDRSKLPDFLNSSSDGSRTTREVADHFAVSMPTARKHLNAMWKSGDLDAADGGASSLEGNAISWSIARILA